ncbi:imidazole glycerol phosphate synthase subunit HisH [Chrysiogenes arsenatis]|uniref:imidazole glycerol phosphate synthase subunit HisH n=1 Tax=Chrysiogenes arsenatis TaxID=309797 RepID=UPI000423D1BC|nr:imidazole glycerol phosphate synthase subunit HisH [Chrysiogenes arsenatis]
MIGIIDYGIGNLRSVQKAFEIQGVEAGLFRDRTALEQCEKLILPGVGAFGDCMAALQKADLEPLVRDWIRKERPLLGICVGMQMLLECSYEFGEHAGLGIITGSVRPFRDQATTAGLKIPQMGWNKVTFVRPSILTEGLGASEYFYFVHSYYCDVSDPAMVLGECDFGIRYCAALERGRLYGTQFHPEKSADAGLKVLKNFAEKG